MTEAEIYERAMWTTERLANDEKAHEMFLEARRELEGHGITRDALEGFTFLSFMALTKEDSPDIGHEELVATARAKTESFMWLIDNV